MGSLIRVACHKFNVVGETIWTTLLCITNLAPNVIKNNEVTQTKQCMQMGVALLSHSFLVL
jgi:hypothetical protein